MLTSEQNLCEMALVKNAARNGAVCYHHDSKEIFVLVFFFPKVPRSIGSSVNQVKMSVVTFDKGVNRGNSERCTPILSYACSLIWRHESRQPPTKPLLSSDANANLNLPSGYNEVDTKEYPREVHCLELRSKPEVDDDIWIQLTPYAQHTQDHWIHQYLSTEITACNTLILMTQHDWSSSGNCFSWKMIARVYRCRITLGSERIGDPESILLIRCSRGFPKAGLLRSSQSPNKDKNEKIHSFCLQELAVVL